MHKYMTKRQRLLKLGVRKDVETCTDCYVRFLNGESPWSLSNDSQYDRRTGGPRSKIVDKRLAYKLHDLFKAGELNFLVEEHEETLNAVIGASEAPIEITLQEFRDSNPGFVEDIMASRKDPFTEARYQICARFEQLAPEALFTRKHLMEIGYEEKDALGLMVRYDELVTYRMRAQTPHYTYDTETGVLTQEPNGLANFPAFTEYLGILYDVYCRTKQPDTIPRYARIAKELRIKGEMELDPHVVTAAEDIHRYQIWLGNAPMNAYLKSLKRLKRTKPSHDKFVETLRAHFYAERKGVKNE